MESQVFEVGPDGGRFDWEGGFLDLPAGALEETPDLPETGRYRVWFSSTIVHFDQANQDRAAFWTIRDVEIMGQ